MTRDELVDKLKHRLSETELKDFDLQVVEDSIHQDAEWWYVPVFPRRRDVRVFDYATRLNDVEIAFEQEGTKLLLIPAFLDN